MIITVTIILANGMTMDELNKEKSKTKDKCMCERQNLTSV